MGCTSLSWPAVACGNDMMDIRMLGSESEKFATKVRIMVDELYFLWDMLARVWAKKCRRSHLYWRFLQQTMDDQSEIIACAQAQIELGKLNLLSSLKGVDLASGG